MQFIYDKRKITINPRQLEILSHIEIEIADKVFNEIAGIEKTSMKKVNTHEYTKNNKPKADDAFKE